MRCYLIMLLCKYYHLLQIFIIQTTGLVLLSLLINATTIQKVLKLLRLADVSLAKKANMTNCVKSIMLTRDRCISMLKMDKFLADANWELVRDGNFINISYTILYFQYPNEAKIKVIGTRLS